MQSLSHQGLWQSFLDSEPSMFDLMSVMSLEPFRVLAWKEFCSQNPTPSQYWSVFSSASSVRELWPLVWKHLRVEELSNDQLIFVIRKRRKYAMQAWRVLKARKPSNAELREILYSHHFFMPAAKLLVLNLCIDDAYLTLPELQSYFRSGELDVNPILNQFPTDEVLTHVMIYLKDTAGSAAATRLLELFPDLRTLRFIRRDFTQHRTEATRLLNRKKYKIIAKMERASNDSP